MRTRIPFFMGLCLAASILTGSCKKQVARQTEKSLLKGTWKVTFFEDKGNNETTHFDGYVFDFGSDGKVTAAKGSTSVTGSWSIGLDDGVSKLYLDFGPPSPFNELNDDWRIKDQEKTEVDLDNVSGGNGGTEYLTFGKL
jgi:hypothetical protein